MAGYKGMGGSATYASIAIDNLKSWSIELPTVPTFDWAVKGADIGTVEIGTAAYGTATLVAVLDYTTGQQDLVDLLDSTSLATHAAGSLVVLSATGKSFTQNAILTGAAVTSPEGDAMSEITFMFRVSGDTSVGWV
jgi:hypothetical protein